MIIRQVAKASELAACTSACASSQTTRCFRSSTWYGAAKSPKVRQMEWSQKATLRENPPLARLPIDRYDLWPVNLLRSANATGALQMKPDRAVSFLKGFAKIPDADVGRTTKLCEEHRVEPLTLTLLARILIRSPTKYHRDMARRLLFSASALDEPAATLQLVSEGLQKSALGSRELEAPLHRLSTLAKTNKNTSAMILLGQILEHQGKVDRAIDYYEEVTQSAENTNAVSADVDGSIAQAFLAIGRIKVQSRDVAGAEAALKKAALEFDEPTAYFYLARFRDPKSEEYLFYNLKAASSGIIEAAHNLGIFYLQQANPGQPTSSSVETKLDDGRDVTPGRTHRTSWWPLLSTNPNKGSIRNILYGLNSRRLRMMAYDWFAVGAEAGFAPSQINLALLLRTDGLPDKGMLWLKQAEGHTDFGPAVERLKEKWWDSHANLSHDV